jgi:hypothetical protein
MARGLISSWAFYKNILTNALFVGSAPEITVYEAGTTTPIAASRLFSVPTGGSAIGNPFTGQADGSFHCWIEDPEPVKVTVDLPGLGELTQDNIPPWTNLTDVVTIDGFQTVSNKTMEDWKDKGGLFFDVGAYPVLGADPYILTNDATPSMRLAGAAAEAAGGGYVIITRWISLHTLLVWDFKNVKIICVGSSQASYNPKVGIIVNTPTLPAIAIRDRASEHGNVAYDGSGGNTGMQDVCLFQNTAPVAGVFESVACGAAIVVFKSAPHMTDDDPLTYGYNGRVEFRNVTIAAGLDCIQIGVTTDKGAAEVIFDRCKFESAHSAILVKGVDYLFVQNCVAAQGTRLASHAFIKIDGACLNQPDSMVVMNCFTEDYWAAMIVRHSAGSVGNSEVYGCIFDGCHIGFWLNPSGTINGLRVWGCTINGYAVGNATAGGYSGAHVGGDHFDVDQSWGFLIERASPGSIGGIDIYKNKIQAFASNAIAVVAGTTPTGIVDLKITDNDLNNNNQDIGGAVISIAESANGSSTFGVTRMQIKRNRVTSPGIFSDTHGAGVVPTHVVAVGLGSDLFVVEDNEGLSGAVTVGVVNPLEPGNFTTKIYRNNKGVKPSTKAPVDMTWNVGPFHIPNMPAGAAGLDMLRPSSTSGDTVFYWLAPYDCVIVSLTAVSSVAPTGEAISFSVTLNGNLSVVLSATIFPLSIQAFDNDSTGIVVAQNTLVGVRAFSQAGQTNNPDVIADLQVVAMG